MTTKNNVKKPETTFEKWKADCGALPLPSFSKSEYNSDGVMTVKVAVGTVKDLISSTLGPSGYWADTCYYFSSGLFKCDDQSVWCEKQANAIAQAENKMLQCFPPPIGMIATLGIYTDPNLNKKINNWWHPNTCPGNDASVAIKYESAKGYSAGDFHSKMVDECIMKKYVSYLNYQFKSINQRDLFAKHDVQHYNGLFKAYTCTHYKLNCDDGKLYSKEVNEPCDSPNQFIFDELPIHQIRGIPDFLHDEL